MAWTCFQSEADVAKEISKNLFVTQGALSFTALALLLLKVSDFHSFYHLNPGPPVLLLVFDENQLCC